MTRAFLYLAHREALSWRFLALERDHALFAWLHCSKVYLMCGEIGYLGVGFHAELSRLGAGSVPRGTYGPPCLQVVF